MNKKEILSQINQLLTELIEDEQKSTETNDMSVDNTNTPTLDTSVNIKAISNELVTSHQLEELEYELHNHPEIYTSVLKRLGINSLRDMEKSRYRTTINEIRRLKLLSKGICICRLREEANQQN